ncbi:MAG: hypothetical protein IPL88_09995 [Rhizobiales bacterium]|nr:hypothetical protein [Hyphomicrobiales bacterium]
MSRSFAPAVAALARCAGALGSPALTAGLILMPIVIAAGVAREGWSERTTQAPAQSVQSSERLALAR